MATARKQTTESSSPSKSAEQSAAGVFKEMPSYDAFLGNNGDNVTAMMNASEAMLAGMAEVSQEVMTFAGARMRHNIESSEDLIHTKDPEEIFEKQCTIARYAAEQYVEETSKLMAMMARISRDCWAPMEKRTKSALHEMNGNGKNGNGAKKE